MTDFDDNQMEDFDDFEDFDVEADDAGSPKGGKRGFVVVLGGVIAIVLLVLMGIAAYQMDLLPGQNQHRYEMTLETNNLQTQTAEKAAVELAMQDVQTAQPSETPVPTETLRLEAMTDEQVLALTSEAKGMPTAAVDHFATATTQAQQTLDEAQAKGIATQDLTATIEVVLTQSGEGAKDASGVLTVEEAMTSTAISAATATALPKTGFADEVGLPALMGAAALMLAIILLARRLRTA